MVLNNNHNSDVYPSAFLGCNVGGGGAMNELCSLGRVPEEAG